MHPDDESNKPSIIHRKKHNIVVVSSSDSDITTSSPRKKCKMRLQRSRNARTKQTSESHSETSTVGSEADNEDISHIRKKARKKIIGNEDESADDGEGIKSKAIRHLLQVLLNIIQFVLSLLTYLRPCLLKQAVTIFRYYGFDISIRDLNFSS